MLGCDLKLNNNSINTTLNNTSMKKIIYIFSLFLIGFSSQAQTKKLNKNAKIALEVDGICGMCKKRIETAALKTKGVKFALWSVKTHQLNIIIDERKTTLTKVQKILLQLGMIQKALQQAMKLTVPFTLVVNTEVKKLF
jgi:hypothetical protein